MIEMEINYKGFKYKYLISLKNYLFICISGAHAYGWDTENSDLDIRQVYFPGFQQLISIFHKASPKHFIDKETNIDFTEYPINHYLKLLGKGNGNCLENLFQEKIYQDKQLVKELQEIILNNLHQGFIQHYLGYSMSIKKDLGIPSRLVKYGEVKLLLSRYRVLLAGLILERTRKVVYNLVEQDNIWGTIYCLSLLNLYKKGEFSERLTYQARSELDLLDDVLRRNLKTTNIPSGKIGIPTIELDRWLTKYYGD